MGIKGLWEIVKPAQIEYSLLNLATTEGYGRNPEKRYFVIGVDMSLWIDSFQAAFHSAGLHTHTGENPELKAFFYRLCNYLKLPVVLVFVSDGPGRPSVKRGRAVRTQPLWMTAYIQELITAFGFYIHQAPGEAEAELAKLNSTGLIDAILTDDSDTLVFGGECVIRRPFGSKVFDHVILYNADAIEHSDRVNLTHGGLILFALLAGGDYDSGIVGCGKSIAHALAQCGFGDTLLDAASSTSGTALNQFLDGWRKDLRDELESNSQGYLETRSSTVAKRITDSFPDLAILDMYMHPLTSWSAQSGHLIPNATIWRIREPLIPGITAFCLQHFGWGRDSVIVKKFHEKLWEGIAFRMLCSPLIRYNNATQVLATPMANILVESQAQSKTLVSRFTPSRRLNVSTQNFQRLMGEPWASVSGNSIVSLHIPLLVLQTAVPKLLEAQSKSFKLSQAGGSKPTMVIKSEVIELTDSEDGDHSVIDLT